jgi:hypothetical protein
VTAASIVTAVVIALAWGVRSLLRRYAAERAWPAVTLIVAAPLELYRHSVGAFNVSPFRVALLIALAMLALDLFRRRRPVGRLAAPLIASAVLLLVELVSVLFVTDFPELATKILLQSTAGLLAAVVIVHFVEPPLIRWAAWGFVASAVLPLAAAAWRPLTRAAGGDGSLPGLHLFAIDDRLVALREIKVLANGVERLQGTFSDPNHFAFYVAVVVIIGAGLLMAEVSVRRHAPTVTALGLFLGAAVTALVGTYSRSGWLVLLCGLGLLCALAGLKRRTWVRGAAVVMAVVTLTSVVAGAAIIDRVAFGDPVNTPSNAEHERTMRVALDLLVERPLTGVGLGSYGVHAGEAPLVSGAHSAPLTFAAELGVPGLLGLLIVIGTTVGLGVARVLRTGNFERRAVIASVVAAYCGTAVASMLYDVWLDDFQWCLFGVLLAMARAPAPAFAPMPRVRAPVADPTPAGAIH